MVRMNGKDENYTKFSTIYFHVLKYLTLVELGTTSDPLGDLFLTLMNLG
jgi:hypothetical protein